MSRHAEHFIRLAIAAAKESEAEGGATIGAVVVRDGEVIATGKSLVWQRNDPSAHAETDAIRNACARLETSDLSGCILYSTLEPCCMCLGCAGWANISEIYFGAYREDIPGNEYVLVDTHAETCHAQSASKKPIKVVGGILQEECAGLLGGYRDWVKS